MVPLFSMLRQEINTETERDEPRHYGLRHAIYIYGNYILVREFGIRIRRKYSVSC